MPQGEGSGFPAAPTGIALVRHKMVGENRVKVSWRPMGNLSNSTTKTRVQWCGRGTPARPAYCKDRVVATVTGAYHESYTFRNLNPGETYRYRLQVTTPQGASKRTEWYRVDIPRPETEPLSLLEQLSAITPGVHYRANLQSSVLMRDPRNLSRVCRVPGNQVRAVQTSPLYHAILKTLGTRLHGIYRCSSGSPSTGGNNPASGLVAGAYYRYDGINTRYNVTSVCQSRNSSPSSAQLVDTSDSAIIETLVPLYQAMWAKPQSQRYCSN